MLSPNMNFKSIQQKCNCHEAWIYSIYRNLQTLIGAKQKAEQNRCLLVIVEAVRKCLPLKPQSPTLVLKTKLSLVYMP